MTKFEEKKDTLSEELICVGKCFAVQFSIDNALFRENCNYEVFVFVKIE